MWYQQRGNKYGAKTTEYGRVLYHSKKEAGFARDCDLRVKAGELIGWDRQVKISLDIGEFHICNYYCDFFLHYANGKKQLVEIKGYMTEIYRLKRKILEATYLKQHPEIEYLVIT
jgi:hypothetical protein